MNDVYLTRVEPAKNMARYYAMSLQPNLFGEWSLVRSWGRIGRRGRLIAEAYDNETEAADALNSRLSTKLRKGYVALRDKGES